MYFKFDITQNITQNLFSIQVINQQIKIVVLVAHRYRFPSPAEGNGFDPRG